MFEYKTRGDKKPQGLQKVFFTCTKEEHFLYFSTVCKMILNAVDCAVWYNDSDTEYDNAEIDLGGMCLFVIPVTAKLLTTNNRTINLDIPFADKHHIPVLPLMMEPGLDELYRNHFGDRHYLDPNQSDSTAISFDDKFKSYILSVIVGNELAEKVRKAFDAYIFLSYRKIDRAYAQQLMRLIHKNDFCRDIAIWYDEFLIPTEDFRNSIENVIEKSTLFSMVVTPNLVVEDNFIRREEYPMARAAGKQILPVEMVETDQSLLAEQYPGIGSVVNNAELPEVLMNNLIDIATRGNDNNPEHCFFIGLAYLNGIDVEKDAEKALGLIQYAAESGVIEAVDKLVNMYDSGDGVERDFNTANEWQEKLCELCYEAANAYQNVDNCYRHLRELWHTGDKFVSVFDFEKAKKYYNMLIEFGHQYSAVFPNCQAIDRLVLIGEQGIGDIWRKLGRWDKAEPYFFHVLEGMEKSASFYDTPLVWHDFGIILSRLGWCRFYAGDLNEAEGLFTRENNLYRELVKKSDLISIRRDYAVSFRSLGKMQFERTNFTKAEEHYSQAVAIQEQIAKEMNTEGMSIDLAETYRMLGDAYRSDAQPDKAKALYKESYEITQRHMVETNTFSSRRAHSVSCIKCGDMCFDNNEIIEAMGFFKEAQEILSSFEMESRSNDVVRDLFICDERLGDCCMKNHNYEEAEVHYGRSLEICIIRDKELDSIETLRDIAIPLMVMGDIKKAKEDSSAALEYYLRAKDKYDMIKERVISVSPQIRHDAVLLLERIGNEYSDEGNWNDAEAAYSEALEEFRALNEGTDSLAELCTMVGLLEKLGNIKRDKGDDKGAERCFEEGVEAFRKLAEITGAAGDKRGVAYCLFMLGVIKSESDPEGAYQYIQEARKEYALLTEAYNEQWAYEDLAKTCYRLGVIRKPYDIDSLREAYSLFKQLFNWFPYEEEYKELRDEIADMLQSIDESFVS